MPIKKILLSSVMIAVFVTYAGYEHVHQDSAGLITLLMNDLAGTPVTSTSVQPVASTQSAPTSPQPAAPAPQQPTAPQPTYAVSGGGEDGYGEGEGEDGYRRRTTVVQAQPQQTTPTPAPQQAQPTQTTPTQTAPTPTTPTQPQGQYKDGNYTGPSVNVYYGNVQVKAVISGGKLTDVQFLQYPSDRSTSVYINSQAMPMLTQEAIQAQSANVSGVSGASETSAGFVQSLSAALTQAHV